MLTSELFPIAFSINVMGLPFRGTVHCEKIEGKKPIPVLPLRKRGYIKEAAQRRDG